MGRTSKISEAFQEGGNLVGLSAAVALSAATLNPLPLLGALVAEAAYLLFVPDSKWYERRLSHRHDAEVEERRRLLKERTLPQLRAEVQDRFAQLEATRQQIGSQVRNDEKWFLEILRKLDYLLEKFLLFAAKEAQFRFYLRSVRDEVIGQRRGTARNPDQGPEDFIVFDARSGAGRGAARAVRQERVSREDGLPPRLSGDWVQKTVQDIQAHYRTEVENLVKLQESESDVPTRAVLTKREQVLTQRSEYVEKIGRILVNLNHQLELLEDTFGLINDQICARSPEQVLADIDSVVYQTDSMTQLLDEIAPYEQMTE